jgi:hypothetical protein
MDDQENALQAEELRREIAQLRRATHSYRMQIFHTKQYTCRNNKLERRLQEALADLKTLKANLSRKDNERRKKAS